MKTRFLTVVALVILGGMALGVTAEAQDTYKFGFQVGLTGPGAFYGEYARKAVEMALEEINAKGGVGGKKLEAIIVDDQLNPTIAVSVTRRFISVDRVPIIMGGFTATSLASIPVAEEAKVVHLTSMSTHPPIAKMSPWSFRLAIDLIRTSEFVTEFSYKRGAKKIGLLVFNNESTRRMGDAVEAKQKALGGELVAKEIMPPGADYRSTILKIKAANPDALHIPSFVGPAALAIKQVAELGWKVPIYVDNPLEDPAFFKTVGDAGDGVMYGSLDLDDRMWKEFDKKFRAKYGDMPDIFAAQYYDGTYVIAEAIKRGGYTAEGIRNALLGIKNFKGVTGNISFDADGDTSLPVAMWTIKGREYVRLKAE